MFPETFCCLQPSGPACHCSVKNTHSPQMAKLWESHILHGQSSQLLLQAVLNGWVLKPSHPNPASAFTPAFMLSFPIQDVTFSKEWYFSPTSINVKFPRREQETKNTVSALLLQCTNPFLLCGSIAVLLPCSSHRKQVSILESNFPSSPLLGSPD